MKKFEFILRINSNIICQRYFAVKNFNHKMVSSFDTLICVEDCTDMIQEQLKKKSLESVLTAEQKQKMQANKDVMKAKMKERKEKTKAAKADKE